MITPITVQRIRQSNDYWFPRLFWYSTATGAALWFVSGFAWWAAILFVGVPVACAVVSEIVSGLCDMADRDNTVVEFRRELDEWGTS